MMNKFYNKYRPRVIQEPRNRQRQLSFMTTMQLYDETTVKLKK